MLSPESLQRIDREIAKYPPNQKQSAVMSALRIAQEETGWLSNEVIEYVATYLEMPAIAAYEVASFYSMYELAPAGRHKITVCTNLPCMLRGAQEIVDHIRKKWGIEVGETTPDGKFSLREGECMGACGDAPLCLVNNHRMEGFLTPDRVNKLVDGLE